MTVFSLSLFLLESDYFIQMIFFNGLSLVLFILLNSKNVFIITIIVNRYLLLILLIEKIFVKMLLFSREKSTNKHRYNIVEKSNAYCMLLFCVHENIVLLLLNFLYRIIYKNYHAMLILTNCHCDDSISMPYKYVYVRD